MAWNDHKQIILARKFPPHVQPNSYKMQGIGDFWVAFRLSFKASPRAKPFIWKLVLFTCKWTKICMWIKLIFIWKASHLDSLWNRGEIQLGNRPFSGFSVIMWQYKAEMQMPSVCGWVIISWENVRILLVQNWSADETRTTAEFYSIPHISFVFIVHTLFKWC